MTDRLLNYGCEVCGSLVEVRRQGVGSLRCCDAPLKLLAAPGMAAPREQETPLLDLVENRADDQSYWHLPPGGQASGISPI